MSEILADAGIAHTVCVATEYGEIVMREQTESTKAMQTAGQPIVNLHCGRMDREQMQKFLHDEGYEIVVDATHPYARVVTENLRGAVDTLKSLEKDAHFPIYLRLERKIDGITEADDIVTNVQYFENNADCAKALENTEGNILLTTGSKELAVYCASGRLKDRLHVRILPGRESLELCMEQGIKGRQILALQGPFSTDSCKRIRVCPRNIPGSIRCLLRRLNHIHRDSQHFRCFQLLLAASGPAAVFRDHMADVVLP